MRVDPAKRRSTVQPTAEGLEVILPAERAIPALLFLPVWLVGWYFGESSAVRELMESETVNPTMIVWLAGWSVGGIAALVTWLWMAVGREILRFSPGTLIVRREIAHIGFSREYDLSQVRNLRATAPLETGKVTKRGRIAFDYGAATVRVAASLGGIEASEVVADVKARMPSIA